MKITHFLLEPLFFGTKDIPFVYVLGTRLFTLGDLYWIFALKFKIYILQKIYNTLFLPNRRRDGTLEVDNILLTLHVYFPQ